METVVAAGPGSPPAAGWVCGRQWQARAIGATPASTITTASNAEARARQRVGDVSPHECEHQIQYQILDPVPEADGAVGHADHPATTIASTNEALTTVDDRAARSWTCGKTVTFGEMKNAAVRSETSPPSMPRPCSSS